MTVSATDYVTVIAGNFLQPLATLVEHLVAKDREGLPGIKANEHEVDWSISSILIAVVMFESWLGRVRLDQGPGGSRMFGALDFYDGLRESHKALPDVTEAFVLRNVIAHNHIWNVQFEWDENEHRLRGLHHVAGGNNKFNTIVDKTTGRSRAHKLHLVPTLIDRTDVKSVLNLIVSAMTGLRDAKLLLPQALTGNAIIGQKGQRVTLSEIAALI